MAMHYQLSSEIHGDGLRTLYFMNPNFLGYPDQPQAPPLPHDPPPEEIPAVHRLHYSNNLWNLVDSSDQEQTRGLSLNLPYDHQRGFQSAAGIDPARNPTAAMEGAITGSKYVKAAQELLDEVASVVAKNDGSKAERTRKEAVVAKTEFGWSGGSDGGVGRGCNKGSELTTAQRQEILMKKAKLSSMLDEVDQRCRQYHHQMQIVVSSFEQLAGTGSARTYTQVALSTILRQFRCLKATVLGQIKDLNKSLGEESREGFRLRSFDHRLRQQRALQQMGMMISNTAWRPQRGLPERAVAVLRAWLFEHFLHPYPKDSDKHMLAKQTGLTRSQVSNWFINARVRLWKPMVEEMYLEETKTKNPVPRHCDTLNMPGRVSEPQVRPDREAGSKSNTLPGENSSSIHNLRFTTGPSLEPRPHLSRPITSLGQENLPGCNPPGKPRQDTSMLPVDIQGGKPGALPNPGFRVFGVPEIKPNQDLETGFQGNGFSLTLGLPEASTGGRQQRFLSARDFDCGAVRMNQSGPNHPGIGNFEILDFQGRKSFQAQVLPDFVT